MEAEERPRDPQGGDMSKKGGARASGIGPISPGLVRDWYVCPGLVVLWAANGALWGVLGAFWGVSGALWRVLGTLLIVLGALGGVLGALWGTLGCPWWAHAHPRA